MEIDAQESLGDKIKRLRSEKGMTQKDLADTEVEQMETAWRHQLAKAYLVAKQPDDAEPLLAGLRGRSDLSQAMSIELDVDYAECRYQQGKYEETLGLLLPLNEQLIEIDYDDAHVRALIQFMIGNCYYKEQNFVTANFYYRSAYDLTLRFPVFDELAARIAYKTGDTLQITGSDQEALLYLNRSYEFYKNNSNLYRLAATMVVQGISYKNVHDYARASSFLSDAIGIFKGLNLTGEMYDVQVTIATAVTVHSNPLYALEQLRECVTAFKRRGSFSYAVIAH